MRGGGRRDVRDDGIEGYGWRVRKGAEGRCDVVENGGREGVVTFASLEFLCVCIPDEQ